MNKLAVMYNKYKAWRVMGMFFFRQNFISNSGVYYTKLFLESYLDMALSTTINAYALFGNTDGSFGDYFNSPTDITCSIATLGLTFSLVLFPIYFGK